MKCPECGEKDTMVVAVKRIEYWTFEIPETKDRPIVVDKYEDEGELDRPEKQNIQCSSCQELIEYDYIYDHRNDKDDDSK